MDATTEQTLRTIYELQFVGRVNPQLTELGVPDRVYFDPVPMLAIRAELAGSQIDTDRECRLLVTMGAVSRTIEVVAQHRKCLLDDGRSLEVTTEKRRDDSQTEDYVARIDGKLVASCNACVPPRLEERQSRADPFQYQIESFAVLKHGIAMLKRLSPVVVEASNNRGNRLDEDAHVLHWNGRTVCFGDTERWEAFRTLWKNRTAPSKIDKHTKYELCQFLSNEGASDLANAIKADRNLGYHLDL